MGRSWVRNTAFGCAVACAAMVAGPGMAGTAVASADLFGVDLDILHLFDHHKEKNKKSHVGGARVGAQHNGGATQSGPRGRIGLAGPGRTGPKNTVGIGRGGTNESSPALSRSASAADASQAATFDGTSAGTNQALTAAGQGGGDGGVPTNRRIGRAPNLAPVPTAPSARSIVIRADPPDVSPAAVVPVVAPLPVAPSPLPVAVPPPASAPADARPRSAPTAPGLNPPSFQRPPADSLSGRSIPNSFRIGYTDYLRTASTRDLLFAVLPGVAGMVLLTAAGGAVGLRQARAAQTLPSPQVARFLP